MESERVSAVAVTAEQDGRLVGNISASDLRCLTPGLFFMLNSPVCEFLRRTVLFEQVRTADAMNGRGEQRTASEMSHVNHCIIEIGFMEYNLHVCVLLTSAYVCVRR